MKGVGEEGGKEEEGRNGRERGRKRKERGGRGRGKGMEGIEGIEEKKERMEGEGNRKGKGKGRDGREREWKENVPVKSADASVPPFGPTPAGVGPRALPGLGRLLQHYPAT